MNTDRLKLLAVSRAWEHMQKSVFHMLDNDDIANSIEIKKALVELENCSSWLMSLGAGHISKEFYDESK